MGTDKNIHKETSGQPPGIITTNHNNIESVYVKNTTVCTVESSEVIMYIIIHITKL
jgi:hypothetical protein